jgi:hypothetical protein
LRAKTDLFKINGQPMLIPDEEVAVNYEDLDSSDSGRDESGFMHRTVVRFKVGSWKFEYSHLTEEEKQYMENLFPNEATFQFTHPSRVNASIAETTECYRSKFGISWKNAKTGLWSGYSFSVIEC